MDYFELSALLKIDVLIIDEIGTVRPDVFCRIWKLIREAERRCNHHVRLIVVGDFLQLLPFYSRDDQEKMKERKLTISNTVWCTAEWNAAIQQKVYLHGSKRATDKGYAEVLNLLANGQKLDYCVDYLNKKLKISQMSIYNLEKLGAVYLSSYRKHVEAVNDYYVEMHRDSDDTFSEIECKHYYKIIKNQKIPKDQEDAEYPVLRKMPIYMGMRVMFVKNSTHYANGTCGTIINISDTRLTVKTDKGEEIIVKQQKIRANNSPTACIKQYPLVPAYAITIHKAQGLTLGRVVVDPETFAAGQLYVALSRTRQIDDIIITRKIKRSDIIYDYEAAQYMRNIQEQYQVS